MTRILMRADVIGDDGMGVTHALVDIGVESARKVDAIATVLAMTADSFIEVSFHGTVTFLDTTDKALGLTKVQSRALEAKGYIAADYIGVEDCQEHYTDSPRLNIFPDRNCYWSGSEKHGYARIETSTIHLDDILALCGK